MADGLPKHDLHPNPEQNTRIEQHSPITDSAAQHLVDLAGSKERAKQAIEMSAESSTTGPGSTAPDPITPLTLTPLQQLLLTFESALLTPIVSGELDSWVQAAFDAFSKFESHLTSQLERQAGEIEQLYAEDQELGRQVEKLHLADGAIRVGMSRLKTHFEVLSHVAPQTEPQEKPGVEMAEAVTKEGIDLILTVKKQEEALKTWHFEAVARDRGAGD